jgi:hypothetical protein
MYWIGSRPTLGCDCSLWVFSTLACAKSQSDSFWHFSGSQLKVRVFASLFWQEEQGISGSATMQTMLVKIDIIVYESTIKIASTLTKRAGKFVFVE